MVATASQDGTIAVKAALAELISGEAAVCADAMSGPQMISRTLSEAMVSAILPAFGSPRASDSANFAACLTVILGRHRRLVRIDDRLDHARARAWRAPVAGRRPQVAGSSIVKPVAAAGLARTSAKSIGCSSHAVLRVAEEHHLLPLDLAERVVLDDDDLDRQVVLHGRGELAHQHREAAVADEGDAPAGPG